MPKDVLKTYEKILLYSTKKATLTGNRHRRHNNLGDLNARADGSLTNRIAKFLIVITGYNTYRVSLRFLCDIALVNHPVKLDRSIICIPETDTSKTI